MKAKKSVIVYSNFPSLRMSYHRYAAELLGTFALTLAVWMSLAYQMPIGTPVIAGLTLGLFVYLLGGISGAHFNPAVTIGIASARKMALKDAALYIICQFVGSAIAMTLGRLISGQTVATGFENTSVVLAAELLGAFFLTFAVMSATLQKIPGAAAGLAIGSALLLGIYVALPLSNAVLNPAVALGIGSFGPMYIIGPIIGGVAGAWARVMLEEAQ